MDGHVTEITCPAKGCKIIIEEGSIKRLLENDVELKNKYSRLVYQAYVKDNKNIRWCPGKGCENAIRVQLRKEKEVVCSCGTKFCFGCGELPHAPTDCNMLKEWQRKIQMDASDANWLAAYTKECPKCSTIIHKDGGCQYMTCGHCNHRFCWMCLGAFDHVDHSCNKLKEEKGVDPNSKRAILNKFIFFYTRFQTHKDSLKLEEKLMEKAKTKMVQLSDSGQMKWIDVQYIKQSTIALFECRTMLMYTYIYGFYLPKNVNRGIFEYLQGDLERAVETLSQLLESKVDEDRIKIINAAEYVRQRQKKSITRSC
jgi:ariadne-1